MGIRRCTNNGIPLIMIHSSQKPTSYYPLPSFLCTIIPHLVGCNFPNGFYFNTASPISQSEVPLFESMQEVILRILNTNLLLTTSFNIVLNCCTTHSYYYIFLMNLMLVKFFVLIPYLLENAIVWVVTQLFLMIFESPNTI